MASRTDCLSIEAQNEMLSPWIACQLGSRERFAIPRALQRRGRLKAMVTDSWLPPGSPIERLIAAHGGVGRARWFAGRFDRALTGAHVTAFSEQSLLFEAGARLRHVAGWPLILQRNEWFQRVASETLARLLEPGDTLFSYSYAARDLFRLAKTRGCRTVLGQIDAAVYEEDLVAEEVARHPTINAGFDRVPRAYWDAWREECDLADTIIVNSRWSAHAIVQAGVAPEKIRVVPLVHDASPSEDRRGAARTCPSAFSATRPLRVLFLGQAIPRKGIFRLLDAADLLEAAPVAFTVVGDAGPLIHELAQRPNISAMGIASEDDVRAHYERADVFVLPTLSDGFALTQLEAAASGLPIICSDRCGEVVEDGVSGLVLTDVSGRALADVLQRVLRNPAVLTDWSAAIGRVLPRFSIDRLADRLETIG